MFRQNSRTLKFAFLVTLTVLCASMITNVALYKELLKYYKLLYAAELDPLGLSYFQSDNNLQGNNKPIVIFFGDSRAAQWIAPQTDDFIFVNRGIGNQTSAQVLLRFEEHVKALHPDVVIVQVCINDLKTIPLFPERKDEIIGTCEANIKSILQKSLELNSTVILTTVFPTSGSVPLTRQLVWSDDVYDGITEVNDFILNYHDDGVIIFDSAKILSNPEGNTKSEYVYDLLHLNASGYYALNMELIQILEGLRTTIP